MRFFPGIPVLSAAPYRLQCRKVFFLNLPPRIHPPAPPGDRFAPTVLTGSQGNNSKHMEKTNRKSAVYNQTISRISKNVQHSILTRLQNISHFSDHVGKIHFLVCFAVLCYNNINNVVLITKTRIEINISVLARRANNKCLDCGTFPCVFLTSSRRV